MTTEDKLLLVQDLCARLPYGVQVQHITTKISGKLHDIIAYLLYNEDGIIYNIDAVTDFFGECDYVYLEYFKPYLFPMSSMTEEQKRDYQYITERWMNDPTYTIGDSFDWLNKNHFDYRGLIPKGSAIDATGLNIY